MAWYIYDKDGYRKDGPFQTRAKGEWHLNFNKMFYEGCSVAYEGDDTSNNSHSHSDGGGSGSSLLGFIIIFALTYACYDATIGERIDISDVNKYCSMEQLKITGQTKCTEVKRKLSNRYIQELRKDKKTLATLENEISILTKNKQEKCSQNGLNEYGTEGCSTATKNLEKNNDNIIKLTQEISHKQHKIADMQIFSLHKVNASSLNVRECKKTSCKVITQLQSGQEVYAEDGDDEWISVSTEKGQGYVVKKYLISIANYEIKVDLNNQVSNKQQQETIILENNYKKVKNQSKDINNDTITDTVTNNRRNLTPLASAIIGNDRKNIINLINNGANVNDIISCDDYANEHACFSILRLAVKYLNDQQLIKFIIDSGVKTDKVLETGLTEIEVATFDAVEYNANIDILKLLLNSGVPATITNEGYSLLMAASSSTSNPEIINFLIEKGNDVNYADFDGNTALIYAAEYNKNPEIINTLIERGANINVQNIDKMSAINSAAAKNQNPKILETLIKHGAIVDENTLIWAKENENPSVLTFLEKYLEQKSKSSKKILGLPIF